MPHVSAPPEKRQLNSEDWQCGCCPSPRGCQLLPRSISAPQTQRDASLIKVSLTESCCGMRPRWLWRDNSHFNCPNQNSTDCTLLRFQSRNYPLKDRRVGEIWHQLVVICHESSWLELLHRFFFFLLWTHTVHSCSEKAWWSTETQIWGEKKSYTTI